MLPDHCATRNLIMRHCTRLAPGSAPAAG